MPDRADLRERLLALRAETLSTLAVRLDGGALRLLADCQSALGALAEIDAEERLEPAPMT